RDLAARVGATPRGAGPRSWPCGIAGGIACGAAGIASIALPVPAAFRAAAIVAARRGGGRIIGGLRRAGKPAADTCEDAGFCAGRGPRGRCSTWPWGPGIRCCVGLDGGWFAERGRAGRHDAAHGGVLAAAGYLAELAHRVRFDRGQQFVAGLAVLAHVRFADALDLDVRGLQVLVGDDHDVHLVAQFDLDHAGPLLVQQEIGHRRWGLHQDLPGVVLHRVLFDQPQGRQRQRLDAADHAMAVATRAHDLAGFAQAGAQALARQFEEAETGNAPHLYARAVELEGFFHPLLDLALMLWAVHVDEVDDQQAAGIADACLAGNLHRRLTIGVERGFLDVAALG